MLHTVLWYRNMLVLLLSGIWPPQLVDIHLAYSISPASPARSTNGNTTGHWACQHSSSPVIDTVPLIASITFFSLIFIPDDDDGHLQRDQWHTNIKRDQRLMTLQSFSPFFFFLYFLTFLLYEPNDGHYRLVWHPCHNNRQIRLIHATGMQAMAHRTSK